jgi:hypothetical protein
VFAWINRSTITFVVNESVGVAIVLHELFLTDGERPFLLALAGAMMGLPFVLAAEGRGKKREESDDEIEDRWSHLP